MCNLLGIISNLPQEKRFPVTIVKMTKTGWRKLELAEELYSVSIAMVLLNLFFAVV